MPSEPVHMLIVDDDVAVLKLLARAFEASPHSVHVASTQEEARGALRDHLVDVVVADQYLDGFLGLDMIGWPEMTRSHPDFILITGVATVEVALRAIHAGVFEMIQKPFDVAEVVAAVERSVGLRQSRVEGSSTVAALRKANAELERIVAERTAQLNAAYEQAHATKQQSQGLDQLKRQVVDIVSHEFNTPLNVIKGYLSLAQFGAFGPVAPEQTEALRAMEQQVDRIVEMLTEMTHLQSLEGGAFSFRLEPTDLAALTENSVRVLGPFVEARHQQLINNVPRELPPVHGNARQLSVVLSNLLLNAIRFTPDGGLITVAAEPEPLDGRDAVLLMVRDNGVGIAPEQHESIFGKFYELQHIDHHSTGAAEFGSSGLGLGLSIAKQIVAHHHGRIWVESESGDGASFFVHLPAAPAGDEAAAADSATSQDGAVSSDSGGSSGCHDPSASADEPALD